MHLPLPSHRTLRTISCRVKLKLPVAAHGPLMTLACPPPQGLCSGRPRDTMVSSFVFPHVGTRGLCLHPPATLTHLLPTSKLSWWSALHRAHRGAKYVRASSAPCPDLPRSSGAAGPLPVADHLPLLLLPLPSVGSGVRGAGPQLLHLPGQCACSVKQEPLKGWKDCGRIHDRGWWLSPN